MHITLFHFFYYAYTYFNLFSGKTINAKKAPKRKAAAAMDEVFKDTYKDYAFSLLPLIESVDQRQVHDMPLLWNKVDELIDRDEFFLSFAAECKEMDLPYTKYDLDSAFIKAQTEWAEDLMVATADYILKWFEHEVISTQVAFWDDGHICVDTTVCKRYRDWLIGNLVISSMSDNSVNCTMLMNCFTLHILCMFN